MGILEICGYWLMFYIYYYKTSLYSTSVSFVLFFFFLSPLLLLFFYKMLRVHNGDDLLKLKRNYNEGLLQSQIEIQEATFHQISEEIHNNIGQLLSSTKMLIGITERSLDSIPDTLKTAEQTLGKAIQDLRSLSKSLNKEWLHQFNITDNLKTEMERINVSCTIQAEYYTSTTFLPMQAEAQVMLFRIVQEALQNSIRQANATRVTVRTLFSEDHITVKIEDDGKGMAEPEQNNNGIGIMNMQHRTQLLGGNIAWNSLPQGTQVAITLPIQKQYV